MMDGMKHYGAGVRQANAINAALDGFKRYGYGIVDKDDFDSVVKFRSEDKEKAEEFVVWKDEKYPDNAPHRLVELFYKEQS